MLGLGPPAQLARSPTARAANVKPSGFIGAVISFTGGQSASSVYFNAHRPVSERRVPGTTPAAVLYRDDDVPRSCLIKR